MSKVRSRRTDFSRKQINRSRICEAHVSKLISCGFETKSL
jgi:hypothetical protein